MDARKASPNPPVSGRTHAAPPRATKPVSGTTSRLDVVQPRQAMTGGGGSSNSNASGGVVLPMITIPSQQQSHGPGPGVNKRMVWTTPRSPAHEALAARPPSLVPARRQSRSMETEQVIDAAINGYIQYWDDGSPSVSGGNASPPSHSSSRVPDGAQTADTETGQLAYMEQMYSTIQMLNVELEQEREDAQRRTSSADYQIDARERATLTGMQRFGSNVEVSENFGLVGSHVPLCTSSAMSAANANQRFRPHQPRSTSPPEPSAVLGKDQLELCAALGKNAELRIRSREIERQSDQTSTALEQTQRQMKLAERRIANREEKLRALLKEKLHWQNEMKDLREQVVEEKMRQVDLFRRLETTKREAAAQVDEISQSMRDVVEENNAFRAHLADTRNQLVVQGKRMDDLTKQSRDEKEKLLECIAEARNKFREWKDGEATALKTQRDQAINHLKAEYELKIARHQEEKQKLREKVKDLEVSVRLMQKDRSLSPLELSLRKATILGSKDHAGTTEAELIEAHVRIKELEALLEHSQEFQKRQENIIKVSEATISRLVQEREVAALDGLAQQALPGSHAWTTSPSFRNDPSQFALGSVGSGIMSTASLSPRQLVAPTRPQQKPASANTHSLSSVARQDSSKGAVEIARPVAPPPRTCPIMSPARKTSTERVAKSAALSDSSSTSASVPYTASVPLPSAKEQFLVDKLSQLQTELDQAREAYRREEVAKKTSAETPSEPTDTSREEQAHITATTSLGVEGESATTVSAATNQRIHCSSDIRSEEAADSLEHLQAKMIHIVHGTSNQVMPNASTEQASDSASRYSTEGSRTDGEFGGGICINSEVDVETEGTDLNQRNRDMFYLSKLNNQSDNGDLHTDKGEIDVESDVLQVDGTAEEVGCAYRCENVASNPTMIVQAFVSDMDCVQGGCCVNEATIAPVPIDWCLEDTQLQCGESSESSNRCSHANNTHSLNECGREVDLTHALVKNEQSDRQKSSEDSACQIVAERHQANADDTLPRAAATIDSGRAHGDSSLTSGSDVRDLTSALRSQDSIDSVSSRIALNVAQSVAFEIEHLAIKRVVGSRTCSSISLQDEHSIRKDDDLMDVVTSTEVDRGALPNQADLNSVLVGRTAAFETPTFPPSECFARTEAIARELATTIVAVSMAAGIDAATYPRARTRSTHSHGRSNDSECISRENSSEEEVEAQVTSSVGEIDGFGSDNLPDVVAVVNNEGEGARLPDGVSSHHMSSALSKELTTLEKPTVTDRVRHAPSGLAQKETRIGGVSRREFMVQVAAVSLVTATTAQVVGVVTTSRNVMSKETRSHCGEDDDRRMPHQVSDEVQDHIAILESAFDPIQGRGDDSLTTDSKTTEQEASHRSILVPTLTQVEDSSPDLSDLTISCDADCIGFDDLNMDSDMEMPPVEDEYAALVIAGARDLPPAGNYDEDIEVLFDQNVENAMHEPAAIRGGFESRAVPTLGPTDASSESNPTCSVSDREPMVNLQKSNTHDETRDSAPVESPDASLVHFQVESVILVDGSETESDVQTTTKIEVRDPSILESPVPSQSGIRSESAITVGDDVETTGKKVDIDVPDLLELSAHGILTDFNIGSDLLENALDQGQENSHRFDRTSKAGSVVLRPSSPGFDTLRCHGQVPTEDRSERGQVCAYDATMPPQPKTPQQDVVAVHQASVIYVKVAEEAAIRRVSTSLRAATTSPESESSPQRTLREAIESNASVPDPGNVLVEGQRISRSEPSVVADVPFKAPPDNALPGTPIGDGDSHDDGPTAYKVAPPTTASKAPEGELFTSAPDVLSPLKTVEESQVAVSQPAHDSPPVWETTTRSPAWSIIDSEQVSRVEAAFDERLVKALNAPGGDEGEKENNSALPIDPACETSFVLNTPNGHEEQHIQVAALEETGDIALGPSTSSWSANVINETSFDEVELAASNDLVGKTGPNGCVDDSITSNESLAENKIVGSKVEFTGCNPCTSAISTPATSAANPGLNESFDGDLAPQAVFDDQCLDADQMSSDVTTRQPPMSCTRRDADERFLSEDTELAGGEGSLPAAEVEMQSLGKALSVPHDLQARSDEANPPTVTDLLVRDDVSSVKGEILNEQNMEVELQPHVDAPQRSRAEVETLPVGEEAIVSLELQSHRKNVTPAYDELLQSAEEVQNGDLPLQKDQSYSPPTEYEATKGGEDTHVNGENQETRDASSVSSAQDEERIDGDEPSKLASLQKACGESSPRPVPEKALDGDEVVEGAVMTQDNGAESHPQPDWETDSFKQGERMATAPSDFKGSPAPEISGFDDEITGPGSDDAISTDIPEWLNRSRIGVRLGASTTELNLPTDQLDRSSEIGVACGDHTAQGSAISPKYLASADAITPIEAIVSEDPVVAHPVPSIHVGYVVETSSLIEPGTAHEASIEPIPRTVASDDWTDAATLDCSEVHDSFHTSERNLSSISAKSRTIPLVDPSRYASSVIREMIRDPTLMAYDVKHEQGQPFAMLDEKILTIDQHARHLQHDENDKARGSRSGNYGQSGPVQDGVLVTKKKKMDYDSHRKSIAFRNIPAFNYEPVHIRFQWSDFVVATPIRLMSSSSQLALITSLNGAANASTPGSAPAGAAAAAVAAMSNSPVQKMKLLLKKGVKLPCGTYVIISVFNRPLEDGNENLRIQIYDAECVEEFQYDFHEDHLREYVEEWHGRDDEARDFVARLEFRRELGSVIIKMPEKLHPAPQVPDELAPAAFNDGGEGLTPPKISPPPLVALLSILNMTQQMEMPPEPQYRLSPNAPPPQRQSTLRHEPTPPPVREPTPVHDSIAEIHLDDEKD